MCRATFKKLEFNISIQALARALNIPLAEKKTKEIKNQINSDKNQL